MELKKVLWRGRKRECVYVRSLCVAYVYVLMFVRRNVSWEGRERERERERERAGKHLFGVMVPLCPCLSLSLIHLSAGNLIDITITITCYTTTNITITTSPSLSSPSPSHPYLEGNCLIWLSSEHEILPLSVGSFQSLFKCRHESMTRTNTISDLRIVHL